MTAFGHCHSTEDERHWESLAERHPFEEVLMPMRSIEQSLFEMLKTTERSALKSWKSHKASALRPSLPAFLWQTLHVQGSYPLMNSGAEKPH